MPLSGKIAIITGASRGIGEATAYELAAKGVQVFLTARSREAIEAIAEKINKSGGKAAFLASDMARYLGVETVVRRCMETFGSVDILVQNAGVIDPIARITDSDPRAWAKTMETNLNAVYYGLHAALPIMEKQGSGLVINISSGAAHQPLEGWSHYCASKAAVHHLNRVLHVEEAANGIRALVLSPGTVATDMQVIIRESGVNAVSRLKWEDHIPPEWPAKALVWMAGPDADDYLGKVVSLREPEIRTSVGLA